MENSFNSQPTGGGTIIGSEEHLTQTSSEFMIFENPPTWLYVTFGLVIGAFIVIILGLFFTRKK